MACEHVEARVPLPLLLGDPFAQRLHSLEVQAARSPLPVHSLVDQPATPEDPDVPGNSLVGHVEGLSQLTDRRLAGRQPGDDGPTGPVAEGGEGGVQFGVDVGNRAHEHQRICNNFLAQANG